VNRPALAWVAMVGLALVMGALLAGTALAAPRGSESEGADGRAGEPVKELEHRHRPSARGGARQPPGPRSPRVRPDRDSKRHARHRRPERGTPGKPPFALLPSPALPAAVLESWRVPLFLLPVYQAAGLRYGVRWEVLAAINEVETNYGQNPTESSAGAVGWMQFMPATWRQWGVDANSDGVRDPADPVDAIFSAARYLRAAGAATDLRRAVFAYNHADWYVDTILLRARLIGSYPARLTDSLTGLASARFPVAARARYATGARAATIYSKRGAPAVAVADGVVRGLGRSRRRGRYVDLEDAYGNRYGYSHLGTLARFHQVPRRMPRTSGLDGSAVTPITAAVALSPLLSAAPQFVKRRLFAHPARRRSQAAGGFEQLLMSQGYNVFDGGVAGPLRLDPRYAVLKPLRRGSHVLASTLLGRVRSKGPPTMRFAVRPPGRDSLPLDPRPVIEAWAALARERFAPDPAAAVLSLPQDQLERRVLADPRVAIYRCGRRDIRAHRIDRRVIATLAYLAESGLDPRVSALECGHSRHTASGNVSEHSAGAGVDISAVGGIPILGNQQPGGVAEKAVRRLMLLQGDARPHQIISLLPFGSNTMALSDHADHLHVGFYPAADVEPPPARLVRREWTLLGRALSDMPPPVLPPRPSRWSLRR
jgi:soluble lytic murein transglycosylase-like protein